MKKKMRKKKAVRTTMMMIHLRGVDRALTCIGQGQLGVCVEAQILAPCQSHQPLA